MPEYYFNNLDPTSFQRLVNAVLVARFGDDLRVLPLRGTDGGRDAETPILHPEFRYEAQIPFAREGPLGPVPKGRHLFQVKHHRTTDVPIATARSVVVSDFVDELQRNVLPRSGEDRVNYFFLITNVPSSKESIDALDQKRKALLVRRPSLHADVWWQADLFARLDQLPRLWSAFPDLFAGRIVPFLGQVAEEAPDGLPKAFRLALALQYNHDRSVRFRQIDLNNSLARLFVDLDVESRFVAQSAIAHLIRGRSRSRRPRGGTEQPLLQWPTNAAPIEVGIDFDIDLEAGIDPTTAKAHFRTFESSEVPTQVGLFFYPSVRRISAMDVLTSERDSIRDVLLEGGPGQGKSTISQMLAQVYRAACLGEALDAEGRWKSPEKPRMPVRLDLRGLAEWLADDSSRSVDAHIASVISQDSGGRAVSVEDLHDVASKTPLLV